jgi:hypothetical protein
LRWPHRKPSSTPVDSPSQWNVPEWVPMTYIASATTIPKVKPGGRTFVDFIFLAIGEVDMELS